MLKLYSGIPTLTSQVVGRGMVALLGGALLVGGNATGVFAGSMAAQSPRLVAQSSPSPSDNPNQSDRANPDRSNQDVVVDTDSSTPGTSTPRTSTPDSSIPGTSTSGPSATSGTRFSCAMANGQYTVMYHPESRPGQSYPWAVPSLMGGGWDPAKRCYEISRRLESYRPDGLLEMQTALENGYNTVCVTTQRISSCRIVLTVPPGQDPNITRDRVFQNLTVADSGQQTQGVNTFVEGGNWSGNQGSGLNGIVGEAARWLNIGIPGLDNSRSAVSRGINLRPFLDRADGGTGEYLSRGMTAQPGRRLQPNKFR